MDKERMLRRLLRFTGRIPTRHKLLYPFWLAAQLDIVVEDRLFPGLPPSLEGLVIAYASDIHYGPLLKADRVHDLVARLNALQADIIVLGGDYGEDCATAHDFFRILPPLSARLGVWGVIGNHDHMGSPEAFAGLLDTMRQRGVQPLCNEAVTLTVGEATLCLCSTDDIKQGQPDFGPLLQASAAANWTIYLPHSPDLLPVAMETPGFTFDMALCGHTHGGQLVVAGRSLHSSSRYGDRFRTGWLQEKGIPFLVSNGVGCSLLPIRLGTRAQMHRIVLRWQTG
ncbi:MAG: hypothetical protein GX650_02385 [Clostridiales bacterium]|nr:hypothetical protein [Clostridiales bacterium]